MDKNLELNLRKEVGPVLGIKIPILGIVSNFVCYGT